LPFSWMKPNLVNLARLRFTGLNRKFARMLSDNKIIPNRKITSYSAILLLFRANGSVDWDAFCAHVARTAEAGLTPAVNMDMGYVNLIDEPTDVDVLRRTRQVGAGETTRAVRGGS
jgi:hypothetical protein